MATKAKPATEQKFSMDVEEIDFDGLFQPFNMHLKVHNGDPQRQYRWVRNSPERIQYWEFKGFTVDQDPNVKAGDPGQPDTRKTAGKGEMVLMSRPMEIAMKHRAHLDRAADKMAFSPREKFKGEVQKAGLLPNRHVDDKTTESRGPLNKALARDELNLDEE